MLPHPTLAHLLSLCGDMKVPSHYEQRLWKTVACEILHEGDLDRVRRLLFELLEAIEDQLLPEPLETDPESKGEIPTQWIN